MGFIDFFFTGVGLAMDACAVSAAHGLSMKRLQWGRALAIAIAFALFQGLMPWLGFSAGSLVTDIMTDYGCWVAFVLLAIVGGKMIWDNFHEKKEDAPEKGSFLAVLLLQAIATSIDALAVGFSMAALGAPIYYAIAVISSVTFVMCLVCVILGHRLGGFLADKAQLAGGIILILIGLKLVLFP